MKLTLDTNSTKRTKNHDHRTSLEGWGLIPPNYKTDHFAILWNIKLAMTYMSYKLTIRAFKKVYNFQIEMLN